ncbi:Protein Family fam60a [Dermatophagoides farinae]|uniref:Protein Family fam60a n=1 Tax=Dermatophagoides farinae TaxID=6954 RepID=A0A922HP31_DERFA|nr:Protein Family fam60a [Dermatophagoides farinae]
MKDEDDENILKLVDKKRKKKSTKMFSFHKPKIYRSNSGCCICRAKSSSSRFTDSKKYEAEFEKCFRIDEKRTGEICNACVLLVKRWKKLPTGTNKNWHHVVDARAGPVSFVGKYSSSPIRSGGESSADESESTSDVDMEMVDVVVDCLDDVVDMAKSTNNNRRLRRSTRLAAGVGGGGGDDNDLLLSTYHYRTSTTTTTTTTNKSNNNQQMLKKQPNNNKQQENEKHNRLYRDKFMQIFGKERKFVAASFSKVPTMKY